MQHATTAFNLEFFKETTELFLLAPYHELGQLLNLKSQRNYNLIATRRSLCERHQLMYMICDTLTIQWRFYRTLHNIECRVSSSYAYHRKVQKPASWRIIRARYCITSAALLGVECCPHCVHIQLLPEGDLWYCFHWFVWHPHYSIFSMQFKNIFPCKI